LCIGLYSLNEQYCTCSIIYIFPGTIISKDKSNFWQFFDLREFVAIDLETTGLDPEKDAIIELGAVKFSGGIATDRFSQLLNPLRPLSPFITELTGIKNSDLKGMPLLEDKADQFIDFVGDLQMVGHHFSFDLGFLSAAFPTANHFNRSRTIPLSHDTSQTSRFIYPCLDSYSLANLVSQFKIKNKSCHRAVEDAEATGMLFIKLLYDLSAVPLPEIATALRFVEGTASPLANTLRSMRNLLASGYQSDQPPPNALKGPGKGRNNIFKAEGEKRPTEPASEKQIRQLMRTPERFTDIMPDYEIREEQIGMAMMTSQAFKDDKILIVEAGTGVGKSMGYLAPALLSGGRVVIATCTKNLQDQLFYDEIPRLGQLFKFGFSAALLKGRRNYICRSKWKNWTISPERVPSPFLREKAALISRWVNATTNGDLSEVNTIYGDQSDGFFYLVASEPGFCRAGRCGENNDCFLMRIRRFAQKADLLVVNHSLVFSDINTEGGLLGDFGRMIFDEAHHIEDTATDQFSSDLTAPAVKAALERAARLCRRGGELWTVLNADKSTETLASTVDKILSGTTELLSEADSLFLIARSLFQHKITDDDIYSKSFRYFTGDIVHQNLAQAGASLFDGLDPLCKAISKIAAELDDTDEDEKNIFPDELLQEIRGIVNQLVEILDSLQLSLEADDKNRVYWVELPPDLDRPVRLRSAPLEVANLLMESLWKRLNSAVLTSATLATKDGETGFEHLIGRLGLNMIDQERLETARFGSPFDYENNCLVCSASFMPSPVEEYTDHCTQVADICAELVLKHSRNMLMLFTSYNAMRLVEKQLNEKAARTGLKIMSQQHRGSPERLVNTFRKSENAILLGTDSLWEGIDVPGKGLQIVVIPRLPFAVPSDPIISARIDHIRSSGENPFFNFQLPTAILRLRQGTGRLIRTMQDRGVIIVMDPRVATKGYGRDFRGALNGKELIARSREQLFEGIGEFFNE
jgi:predicted DnaQ family exonuclease/DinG family helicase